MKRVISTFYSQMTAHENEIVKENCLSNKIESVNVNTKLLYIIICPDTHTDGNTKRKKKKKTE